MEDKVRIVIAGDLFPTPINYQLFSSGKVQEIFDEEVLKIFKNSDFRVCNLEGCFTGESTQKKQKDGPNIRAPRDCISGIVGLGVDCVSLANNHATDYGIQGLKDTYSTLDAAGIKHFGSGYDVTSVTTHYSVRIKEKTIIFYGVSETIENSPSKSAPGVNIYDEYRICSEIRLLKSQSDLLIVMYHGGIENTHYNTPSIRLRFHRMAESGADIIISQHTHAIGEEEYYKNSYLLYGQGNFCFHFSKKLTEWVETGLLLEIDYTDNGYSVNKHVVRRDGPYVRYDKEQNLEGFFERSKRLSAGDEFKPELKKLADEKVITYLHAFRGNNFVDRMARKVLSDEKYLKYLKKQYSQRHILRILLALQSEEFREISTQGLSNMLEELEEKYDK